MNNPRLAICQNMFLANENSLAKDVLPRDRYRDRYRDRELTRSVRFHFVFSYLKTGPRFTHARRSESSGMEIVDVTANPPHVEARDTNKPADIANSSTVDTPDPTQGVNPTTNTETLREAYSGCEGSGLLAALIIHDEYYNDHARCLHCGISHEVIDGRIVAHA